MRPGGEGADTGADVEDGAGRRIQADPVLALEDGGDVTLVALGAVRKDAGALDEQIVLLAFERIDGGADVAGDDLGVAENLVAEIEAALAEVPVFGKVAARSIDALVNSDGPEIVFLAAAAVGDVARGDARGDHDVEDGPGDEHETGAEVAKRLQAARVWRREVEVRVANPLELAVGFLRVETADDVLVVLDQADDLIGIEDQVGVEEEEVRAVALQKFCGERVAGAGDERVADDELNDERAWLVGDELEEALRELRRHGSV